MLTIQVISYKGAPPRAPQVGVFTGETGTIGRGDANTLVLLDPERQISRTHLRITLENGAYRIDNQGTGLPVLINERSLEPGEAGVLAHADQLQLGPYVMRVALAVPQAPARAAAPPPTQAREATQPQAPGPAASGADPLALFGSNGTPQADPFADLLAPPPPGAAQPPAALLPDDFDPFAPIAPAPIAIPARDMGAQPGAPSQSLDELFGLGGGPGTSPFKPGNPLAEPIAQANTARAADPLAALQAGAVRQAKPATLQRDDAPEVNAAFPLPKMVPAAPSSPNAKPGKAVAKPAVPEPVKRAQAAPRPAPSDQAFRSWEHADARGEIAGVKQFDVEPKPAASKPRRDNAAPAAGDSATAEVLLHALLEGAGVTDLARPPKMTPELMRVFGQLLRIAADGTLQLLVARALTKREVQAEATLMAPGDNNPLKFSPTVEVALQHLLSPQGRGFMSPTRALQDAFDDLRSHQFGVMAGTQAALAGVLARFAPQRLEGRLLQKSMLDSLLPMNRKARLWDLFIELYGDISKEAEEDFHALFGREFAKAYEAQIEQLRDSKR